MSRSRSKHIDVIANNASGADIHCLLSDIINRSLNEDHRLPGRIILCNRAYRRLYYHLAAKHMIKMNLIGLYLHDVPISWMPDYRQMYGSVNSEMPRDNFGI